jgi:cytochrome bd-type quinol oxidase subunit 2
MNKTFAIIGLILTIFCIICLGLGIYFISQAQNVDTANQTSNVAYGIGSFILCAVFGFLAFFAFKKFINDNGG